MSELVQSVDTHEGIFFFDVIQRTMIYTLLLLQRILFQQIGFKQETSEQDQYNHSVEIIQNKKQSDNLSNKEHSSSRKASCNPQEEEQVEDYVQAQENIDNDTSENNNSIKESIEQNEAIDQEKTIIIPNSVQEHFSQQNNSKFMDQKEESVKQQDEQPQKQEEKVIVEDISNQQKNSTKNEEQQTKSEEQIYTLEKRMLLANQMKDQAKDLIKEKKYTEALYLYQQALEITNPTYFKYVGDDLKDKYTELSTQLLNNLAFCYFHIGNYQISADICAQTLLIDPKNLKAMYRRAVCFKNLGDLERAFETIKTAVKSGGNESKDIYAEYESIKALYKDYIEKNKQKEKEVYGRMMNSSQNKAAELKKLQELENKKLDEQYQNLYNSIFFFGSTAMSFLVASKVMKIDVTSKTGFSLSSSFAASVYGSYYFGNKWIKGIFSLCSLALFGYMYRKSIAL